jgi:hypothetical protein
MDGAFVQPIVAFSTIGMEMNALMLVPFLRPNNI